LYLRSSYKYVGFVNKHNEGSSRREEMCDS
jgi:hypothetical protein